MRLASLVILAISAVLGLAGEQYEFTLKHQAFPASGHPGALVYVPPGFAPTNNTNVVVYFHGFWNCVGNIVRAARDARNCSAGGPVRDAFSLLQQFDDAGVSDALFVAPEVAFDQASSDIGNFWQPGGFVRFFDELFAELSAHLSTPLSLPNVTHMSVYSHSGAYNAAIMIAQDLTVVREVNLFDSLYGQIDAYDVWFKAAIPELGNKRSQYRFANIYTDSGGTYAHSVAMGDRVAQWLAQAGLKQLLLADNTYSTLTAEQYAFPVIFKRSQLGHNDVPRYYFRQLLEHSAVHAL